jgi:hypothetical protein
MYAPDRVRMVRFASFAARGAAISWRVVDGLAAPPTPLFSERVWTLGGYGACGA